MPSLLKQSGFLQKLLVSAGIMAALFFSMDLSKLSLSFADIHYSSWLVASALIFVQIIALSYRWLKMINVYGRKITFKKAVTVNVASLLANYLFITSIGGIIVRVGMSVQSGISLMRSIAATGLDRIFTLLGLLILTIIFLPIFSGVVSDDVFQQTLLLVLAFFAGGGLLALMLYEEPRKKIIFSHRKVAMCFQYLRCVLTDRIVLGKIAVSSLIGQMAYFMAAYVILSSMGVGFSLLHFMAIIPVITIIASLPIGYGGWGIREGAFAYGLAFIGIPFETAFASSVQIGLLSMMTAIIAGVPVLFGAHFKRLSSGLRDTVSNG